MRYLAMALVLLAGCDSAGSAPPPSPPAVNQCLSPADLSILITLEADAGADGESLGDAIGPCIETPTSPCYPLLFDDEADVVGCLRDCLTEPVKSLTTGCLECHAEVVACVQDNCLIPCVAASAECGQCIAANCIERLTACTGLPYQ